MGVTGRSRLLLGAALALCLPAVSLAAEADEQQPTTVEGVTVTFGRAEQRIGKAVAASEGALAGADLTVRPVLRTAEILELVPGMMVTQHSGSGKANQYFLRGFNLDHGTDFGLEIDGVPMNFRTHGHGQGYLDINGLIPEVVSRVDYRKGPYRADAGDFNLVGGARISTRDDFDAPYVIGEYGAFDHKRLAAGGSFDALGGTVMLAGQLKTYDGPWELPEHLRHVSLFGKHSMETGLGRLETSLSVYDATWRPTEQIPERAVGTLVKDAYGALDKDLKGRTEREILNVQLEGPEWRGNAYVQHYDWAMVQNFTFFLDDPINGDQRQQTDQLWTYGGRLERMFAVNDQLNVTLGGETRYDDISKVALYQTVKAKRIASLTEAAVKEASGGLYGEATWKPVDQLTLFAGLRADAYRFDVKALGGGAWSGKKNDHIVSPKLGITYQPIQGLAFYGNWGEGFHSNDSRGVTNPVDPAPGLVKGKGKEIGTRFERYGLVATASYWWLSADSELLYVGDAGSVEPSSASARRGYELTAFYRPTGWLAIDGVWTGSHARFKDSPGADHIPGAIKNTGEIGVSVIRDNWNAGARLRYLGKHPLVEDNSLQSEPTTILNFRAAWTPGRYEIFGELLNALDSKKKDIEYWYESYLPQIDRNGPVEDLHARAVEPRMLRGGIKIWF